MAAPPRARVRLGAVLDEAHALPAQLARLLARSLLAAGDVRIDAFLCPGHVSVIIGWGAYEDTTDSELACSEGKANTGAHRMTSVVIGTEAGASSPGQWPSLPGP